MSEGNSNSQLRIGVVGIGPVGAVLVAHLLEAGAFVVPCDVIKGRMDSIRKSGIHLKHAIEKHVAVPQVCHSTQQLSMYDLDLIVISAKTPALDKVIEEVSQIDSDKLFVMCAQNGIDNETEVAKVFGDSRTLRMVVNYAGNMSGPNSVHVSFFNPPNYLAAMMPEGDPIANQLVELLNSVGLTTEIPEDIQDYVWGKTILNAALSPVCAITRQTMKEVMDFPETFELVEALIDESIAVAEKEGIDLGKKFRRFGVRYLKNAGHHRPSMLIDLDEGHRTEIDRLNGKIVEYGKKHYTPTPLNLSVSALIRLLEYSSEK
jgi:2-dehydropantoate 2-reductase